ncbi:hypothetical protein CEUSTIGMA_g9284.t1 [Chlamydomonas eustigma]|uniref:Myb-like domain-containing protein n=1 Tax=Chlamydomonas eustigma TaxID=1157962 RepID=A0A250XFP7_9CHLO|nr:hypothetical protein CEUSTIGMA_g9284.t1 [Chlamydomonas eustigma]|eukprot:GAX81856.1 hypothetical protein CEUSTIGMA_g9284.t1 [Chlamydomonas eustigma]
MEERQAWASQMREKFSPKGMVNMDGTINQEFFRPKHVLLVKEKRWGIDETDLLYKGIERFGVGKCQEISMHLLPEWSDQQIRARTSKLMGSQSLARYSNWIGDKQAVQQEHERNKRLAEKLGCWKNGMLVENSEGSVKEYFKQLVNNTIMSSDTI